MMTCNPSEDTTADPPVSDTEDPVASLWGPWMVVELALNAPTSTGSSKFIIMLFVFILIVNVSSVGDVLSAV